MSEDNHTKPIGVFVTLREIHQTVMNIDEKLDEKINSVWNEISRMKAQLAALYVIQGIQIATIIFLVQKGLQ